MCIRAQPETNNEMEVIYPQCCTNDKNFTQIEHSFYFCKITRNNPRPVMSANNATKLHSKKTPWFEEPSIPTI